jgi:hypothetical protein
MIDLVENINADEKFDTSPIDVLIDSTDSLHNISANGRSYPFEHEFDFNNDTMRLLFITIVTIGVLACCSICLSVFICVCLNRYVEQ